MKVIFLDKVGQLLRFKIHGNYKTDENKHNQVISPCRACPIMKVEPRCLVRTRVLQLSMASSL